MAYSDYGGYAYRNGVRGVERSDATITPEGDTYGTPGSYPGFALLAEGVSPVEVRKRIEWPSGHAILGDGPVYVVLRKQWASLFKGPEKIRDFDRTYGDDEENDPDVHTVDECEGCLIEVWHTVEDNYYVYAKLTQPDGAVWHGFSGYGVGAGLENSPHHGYSTQDRIDKLKELWPEAVKD